MDGFKRPVVTRASTTNTKIYHPCATLVLRFSAQSSAPTKTPQVLVVRLQSTTQAAKKISSASSAFLEITTTSHRAAKSKEDGASGADETEICGGMYPYGGESVFVPVQGFGKLC